MDRNYFTFNYPGAQEGGKTLLTGIRKVKCSKHKYYISGFYEPTTSTSPVISFLYKGKLDEKQSGKWYQLNFPNSNVTNLYGPNNGLDKRTIQVVGNYTTVETGNNTIGCLYQGPLKNSSKGKWTTLNPSQNSVNTIAHSTNGGLVVGNYSENNSPKAFIYDIKKKKYFEITKPGAVSITAYGIWKNKCVKGKKDIYTICGGFTDLNLTTGIDTAYLVDWDNKNNKLFNWRPYHFNNDPLTNVITHFNGITGDGHGGYYLVGDGVGIGAGIDEKSIGFFVHVDKFAKWSSLLYPGTEVTSGNSVVCSTAIGVYNTDQGINGFISKLNKHK